MNTITNLYGVKQLALRLRNWGRWGSDDELGTLNFVTEEKIVSAARLVRKGRVFSLSIPFDNAGPQRPLLGERRFNPIHTMLMTGADVTADAPIPWPFFRGADDLVILPTQGATHWDALSHVFYEGKMWNGYDCSLVTSAGARKNGIENYKDKVVGRGVLLDMARCKKVNWLAPGYEITSEDLDECSTWEKVNVERGDFLLIRTGGMKQVKERGGWKDYAGGDAPGLAIETAEWLHRREVAAVATDTWGVEVRPNATKDCMQPWHLVVLPNMGLLMGEIFDLEGLAEDCDEDKVYEFMFIAPVIPFTGAVGSPTNPYAIK